MRQHGESGATLVIAMLGIVGMLGAAAVTVLTIRMETSSLSRDHAARVARYAGLAGLNAGIDYAARNCSSDSGYTDLIGTALPGATYGNANKNEPYFNEDGDAGEINNGAYYNVDFINNDGDPSGASVDGDQILVIRAHGYGPGGIQTTFLASIRAVTCSASNFGGHVFDGCPCEQDDSRLFHSIGKGDLALGTSETLSLVQ